MLETWRSQGFSFKSMAWNAFSVSKSTLAIRILEFSSEETCRIAINAFKILISTANCHRNCDTDRFNWKGKTIKRFKDNLPRTFSNTKKILKPHQLNNGTDQVVKSKKGATRFGSVDGFSWSVRFLVISYGNPNVQDWFTSAKENAFCLLQNVYRKLLLSHHFLNLRKIKLLTLDISIPGQNIDWRNRKCRCYHSSVEIKYIWGDDFYGSVISIYHPTMYDMIRRKEKVFHICHWIQTGILPSDSLFLTKKLIEISSFLPILDLTWWYEGK